MDVQQKKTCWYLTVAAAVAATTTTYYFYFLFGWPYLSCSCVIFSRAFGWSKFFTVILSAVLKHWRELLWLSIKFCTVSCFLTISVCIKNTVVLVTSGTVVVRWNVPVFEWSETTDWNCLRGEQSSASNIAGPQHGKPVHTLLIDTSVKQVETQVHKVICLAFWTLGRCHKEHSTGNFRLVGSWSCYILTTGNVLYFTAVNYAFVVYVSS